MIDEDKVLLTDNGQMFYKDKLLDVQVTQKEILHLIDDIFDNEKDFQYINCLLALVHAAKLKDFVLEAGLKESSIHGVLVEHVKNTFTIFEEAEFEHLDKEKK